MVGKKSSLANARFETFFRSEVRIVEGLRKNQE